MAMIRVPLALALCFTCSFFLNQFLVVQANSTQENNVSSGELIHNMCNRTAEPELCDLVVNSDPRDDLKSSPEGIVRILLDSVLDNSTSILTSIGDFLANSTDNATKECLSMCNKLYEDGIHSLQAAKQLLSQKDGYKYGQMNLEVTNFHIQIHDCGDCFSQQSVRGSSLLSMQNNLVKISVTALEIIDLVECNDTDGCVQTAPAKIN